MTTQAERTGKAAIIAVVEAIEAIDKMIKAKGEKSSTALIAGYLSIMSTRVLDEIHEHKEEEA